MKSLKTLILLILVFQILGCATSAKLEARLNQRLGQNINDVIQQIGPPQQTFNKPNGDIMYTWINKGSSTARVVNSWGNDQVQINDNYCAVIYTVGTDSVIKNWNYRGNICKSY